METLLQKYLNYLPLESASSGDSLGEGNTPLVRSVTFTNLFFKAEHMNPTGSFKDRFASVEVALMKQAGVNACIATSSGNTGSALAAYAARQGIRCYIFVNEITPAGKLAQMLVYGARIFRVKGFGVSEEKSRSILERLQELAEERHLRLVISAYKYSPAGMEGVKTIAYELVEQLGGPPDQIFVPVGGGGLLTAIWRGFLDLKRQGVISSLPQINAAQPALNDTIITPLITGAPAARQVDTVTPISGLAVQVDIDATRALKSVRESGGRGFLALEADILEAQKRLWVSEGLYVEPAAAVSVAGYFKAVSQGCVTADEKIVCLITGHGFKAPHSSRQASPDSIMEIDPDMITPSLVGCD